MQAPIRRRLSVRGAPAIDAQDQPFVAHQVPLDAKDPKQAAWNERQWRELGLYVQGLEARFAGVEQALLDLQALVAADTWDRAP